MADNETRVVLVKPGDVLLVGNIGEIRDRSAVEAIREAFGTLDLKAFLFAGDIDIDKIPATDGGTE